MAKEKANHSPSGETGLATAQSAETSAVDHDSDEINMAQVAHFVYRHWRLICGAALIPAIMTVLYTVLFVPRSYTTTATLVIASARLSSLSPPPFTALGYQKILESDAVLAATSRRLIENGILDEGSVLRLGHEVETQIFVSRQSETTSLAPMLQIVARGSTPEKAAEITNTYAQVFLERTRLLSKGTTSATMLYVEEEYPKAGEELTQLENSSAALTEQRQALSAAAVIKWAEKITKYENETRTRIAQYKNETRTLIAQYENETRTLITQYENETRTRIAQYEAETARLINSFPNSKNWETRQEKSTALGQVYAELQSQLLRVKSSRQEKELLMATIRQQLAETPPNLTVHKAITDDALWQTLAGKNGKEFDWSSLEGRSLVSQQVNPLFTELSSRGVQIKLDLDALFPRSKQLSAELTSIGQQLHELEAALKVEETELAQIGLERETELSLLRSSRELQADRLKSEQTQELAAIEQETATLLGQRERNIVHQRDLYTELAKNFNQVTLTKAQQDVEDVLLAAPAVAVERPEPRGTLTKALFALIIGGLGGLLVGFVRDAGGDD